MLDKGGQGDDEEMIFFFPLIIVRKTIFQSFDSCGFWFHF
jgi:hypothetical protein